MSAVPLVARAVVFDLDGVLVDSESVNVASAYEAFTSVGIDLPADARSAIVGRHPIDYVPELAAPSGVSPAEQRRMMERQSARYRALWDRDATLIDGARQTLANLRDRGFPVGLATSAGRGHVEYCIARFALQGVFDAIRTLDDVEQRKPHPQVYHRAFEDLGVAPGDGVVIEDSVHGVQAAVASGAACILVRTGLVAPEAETLATRMVDSVADVPALVRR